MTATAQRILVIGDSVTWGQGLLDAQKMHNLLAVRLVLATGTPPRVFHHAASGARIGFDNGLPTPARQIASWWPRELPEINPTLREQALQAAADHPDVAFDAVIVCGGINDVDVRTIFNPLTATSSIARLTDRFCGQAMQTLLRQLADLFLIRNANARVFVLGYYAVFSPQSRFPDLDPILLALVRELFKPEDLAASPELAIENPVSWIEDRLVQNAQAFRTQSSLALAGAVAQANAALGREAFSYVDPGFGDADAAFTARPLIWGLTNGDPEDPRAADRAAYCAALEAPANRFACERASLGHPNIAGAQRYADKLLAAFQPRAG